MQITPELIARGYAFAADFHRTQLDKAGEPYIRHPIRVAFEVAHMGPEYELVGLFHDLVEDTACTLDDIRKIWGATIADGVAAITHHEDEDYFAEYLPRVMQNLHARTAKKADANDNLKRLHQISDADKRATMEAKYRKVLGLLSG
ncbi:GTP pyrophosphokinase [bacterium MnTg02]|nr:GTP pyrophosphokinase [bacterium MnTg02]